MESRTTKHWVGNLYFSIQNELKLTYGKVNLKKLSGVNTPGPPQKGKERDREGEGLEERGKGKGKGREGGGRGGRGRRKREVGEGKWSPQY